LTDDKAGHIPKNGEILPPEERLAGSNEVDLDPMLLALVNNYTDRPDLFLAEIEKHDPGFIKRMNEASEKASAESRAARFHFGKVQAYAGLVVSVVAAFAILGAIYYAIHEGAGFGTLIAICAIYATTQSGPRGISRLVEAVSRLIGRTKGEKPEE
jgi:hypothetical protein